jgi:hypothetical protein
MVSQSSTRKTGIEFETRYFPLIVVTLEEQISEEDYTRLFAQWEAVLARKERFGALTDARRVKERAPPKQRAMIAEWTKKIEPRVMAYSVGHTTVIESAIIRGAMTAVEWLHKPKVPSAYFPTLREGCDFILEKLRENGVPLTDPLRAYRASLGG